MPNQLSPALPAGLLPPLWIRLATDKIAGLDIHSPLYLKLKHDPYGGGDIGSLYPLVDKMAEAGFSLLQLMPINDTGSTPSPYQALGLFSYNPIHVCVETLPASPQLTRLIRKRKEVVTKRQGSLFVDYAGLRSFKLEALQISYQSLSNSQEQQFEDYFHTCDHHVITYATFITLLQLYGHAWPYWPDKYKNTPVQAIRKTHPELESAIRFWVYTQWVLEKQWLTFSHYAQSKGIYVALDKPIYPFPNSADVWAHQELFYLNEDGTPQYVSGCNSPEDPFGEQVWGHAVYQYQEKADEVVQFYLKQIRFLSRIANVIRLDHTLALIWKYYLVDRFKYEGHHQPALKHYLVQKIKQAFPDIYFIAEDVGYVSEEEVDQPLRENGIPGLRCPQWSNRVRYAQINEYPRLCVALSGNHDTATLYAWWRDLSEDQKEDFLVRFNRATGLQMTLFTRDDVVVNHILEALMLSPTVISMVTLREIAKDTARYNIPGLENTKNWITRLPTVLEELSFNPVAKMIKTSKRHLWQGFGVPNRHVLAFYPSIEEVQRRSSADAFVLTFAVLQDVQHIQLHTNLPSLTQPTISQWREITIQKSEMTNVSYQDSLTAHTITLPIPALCPKGRYELAATLYFSDGKVIHLCRHHRNLQLEVN